MTRISRRSAAQMIAAGAASAMLPGRARTQGADGGPLPGAWADAADVPVATQEVYPAALDGEIYLAGGIASGNLTPYISDELFIYAPASPASKAWRAGPDLPDPRHHVTLMPLEGRLYAIGGYYGSVLGGIWQMKPTVWALAPDTGRWSEAPKLPHPQAEMTSAVLEGRIHCVGGRRLAGEANSERGDHRDVADHLVFDGAGWTGAAPAPTRRNSAAGGVTGGMFYIAGGRNETGNLAATEVYDPAEDRWRSLQPMPLAQAGCAGAVMGGRLYVFGGEIFSPHSGVFEEAWEYDPEADAWRAMAPMPTPRHGLGAVAVDGRIHVIAGAMEPGGRARSTAHEVFTPPQA